MTYFKINEVDFSTYVNKLEIQTMHIYNSRTNASGNKVVKYINTKKIVNVGIIPLSESITSSLLTEINKFTVSVSYRDPETQALETIDCIIPKSNISYNAIRADKVLTNAYVLSFEEL